MKKLGRGRTGCIQAEIASPGKPVSTLAHSSGLMLESIFVIGESQNERGSGKGGEQAMPAQDLSTIGSLDFHLRETAHIARQRGKNLEIHLSKLRAQFLFAHNSVAQQ
jgi:hypothetical protein